MMTRNISLFILLTSLVSYTVAQITFTRLSSSNIPGRAGHTGVLFNATTIIAIGGSTGTEATDPVDPLVFRVPTSPSLPTLSSLGRTTTAGSDIYLPRHQAAIVNVPEDLVSLFPYTSYAFFGSDSVTMKDTNTIFGFNPLTQKWETVLLSITGPAITARKGATAVFIRDCLQGGSFPVCIVITGGVSTTVGTNLGTNFLLTFYPSIDKLIACNVTYPSIGGSYLGPGATSPGGVTFHSAVSSVDGNRMFLFGGLSSNGNAANKDIYEFSPAGFDDNNMNYLTRETTVISRTKTVTFSSKLLNSSNAALIVDGSTTTCFSTANATSVTYPSLANPWIRVDLGSIIRITQVQFFLQPVANVPKGKHIGVKIFVTNGTTGSGFDSAGAVEIPNPYTDYIFNPTIIYPNTYTVGRYVWVVIPSVVNRILDICELNVYTPNKWMWRQLSGFGNLALRKDATQSTMDTGAYNYGNPLNAIDGDVGTTSRSSSKANSWLLVDLGDQYDIQYLTFFDGNGLSPSTGPCRSMNTEIAIGNNRDPWALGTKKCVGPINTNGYGTNNGNVPWTIPCSGRARFLYVRKRGATMPTATTVPASDPTCVYPCNSATLLRV